MGLREATGGCGRLRGITGRLREEGGGLRYLLKPIGTYKNHLALRKTKRQHLALTKTVYLALTKTTNIFYIKNSKTQFEQSNVVT